MTNVAHASFNGQYRTWASLLSTERCSSSKSRAPHMRSGTVACVALWAPGPWRVGPGRARRPHTARNGLGNRQVLEHLGARVLRPKNQSRHRSFDHGGQAGRSAQRVISTSVESSDDRPSGAASPHAARRARSAGMVMRVFGTVFDRSVYRILFYFS